jgi:hypothetical protein
MSKEKIKSMIPLLCIITGSLITVIAAFCDYKQKLTDKQEQLIRERKRKRSDEYSKIIEKSNDILQKNNVIITKQETVIGSSKKIIDLQNELSKKNDLVQELQNNTLNNITGGNNIPRLWIQLVGGKYIHAEVVNYGEFPLRNVTVQLSQLFLDDIHMPNAEDFSDISDESAKSDSSFKIGDIPLNSNSVFISSQYTTQKNRVHYYYEVRWLNGSYSGEAISVVDSAGKVTFKRNNIYQYSKGLNLERVVQFNQSPAVVLPQKK